MATGRILLLIGMFVSIAKLSLLRQPSDFSEQVITTQDRRRVEQPSFILIDVFSH